MGTDAQLTTAGQGTRIELRGLTLAVGDRVLLEEASATFEPGEVTLVVGRSGSGKSTLLRLLAGLVDPGGEIRASGSVQIGGRDVLAERGRVPVGVVFQHFALFDELSPLENVRFAAAHRPANNGRSAGKPEALLQELGVPRNVRTASLSGGQRQRLAIARTLAYDPEVILYDEPTSGLDRSTAAGVAGLIRSTHGAHPKTSVLVTHDYDALAPIADRIYLVDPTTRKLVEIERSRWPELAALIETPDGEKPDPEQPTTGESSRPSTAGEPGVGRRMFDRLSGTAGAAAAFFAGTSQVLEQVLRLPLRLVPLWRSWVWGARLALHYLRLVADPSAWLYLAIAGAIAGFVATYFTFRFLPYRQYTEPLVIEDLLEALGFALYRILVPVLATVLIAARCGAAVASDLGGKVYGQQMDALRTLGIRPERYLLTGILYAFLLGTPLLVGISFLAARWTSLAVFTATHPQFGPFFWEANFHSQLTAPGQWLYRGSGWLLAKVLSCALGTGLIAWLCGRFPKHSTADVSAGITSTILWATLYVLVVHFVFAFYEFD